MDAHLEDRGAWDLRLTDEERGKATEVLGVARGNPVLAVSVGTKVQSKDWGRENWRALLEALGGLYPGYALALMGVPEESEASEFAASGWRAGAGPTSVVINLCGRLTPRESAACFAESRMFLGHDSGPMHLAATVQTPCVAIFARRAIFHGSGIRTGSNTGSSTTRWSARGAGWRRALWSGSGV